ncbi:hypothetical protein [Gordonia sp. (in: high G+C Gram-positive bacteria)]|uniref:hypothetical protein n=1 Tax=Gordonia sp. (in: high G+C Gram-positive bacteria) TaxID=84139 RepID=UPI00333FBD1B
MSNDVIGEVTGLYWADDNITVKIRLNRPRQAPRTRQYFPQMKQRGGRRRARQRERRIHEIVVILLRRGTPPLDAILQARLAVDAWDLWRIPNDPFDPKTWEITTGETR